MKERLLAWWTGLEARERRVLGGGGAVLAVVLAYLVVWEPLVELRRERENALNEARALSMLIERLAAEAQRGRPVSGGLAGAGQSLLAVVDQSRRASAITKPPSRIQPDGDATVRVWLEDVPFDALVRWLHELQTRYGVRVDNADIERESGPGLVNARLTLMR